MISSIIQTNKTVMRPFPNFFLCMCDIHIIFNTNFLVYEFQFAYSFKLNSRMPFPHSIFNVCNNIMLKDK